MIDPGESLWHLSLNERGYSHGTWFIARVVDGDYLQIVALRNQPRTWMAYLKTVAINEVSKLLSFRRYYSV